MTPLEATSQEELLALNTPFSSPVIVSSQKSSSPDPWRREGAQEQEMEKQRGSFLWGQPVLTHSLLVILGWGQDCIQISLQDAGCVSLCQCPCVPRNLMHAERHQKGNTNHALNKLSSGSVAKPSQESQVIRLCNSILERCCISKRHVDAFSIDPAASWHRFIHRSCTLLVRGGKDFPNRDSRESQVTNYRPCLTHGLTSCLLWFGIAYHKKTNKLENQLKYLIGGNCTVLSSLHILWYSQMLFTSCVCLHIFIDFRLQATMESGV